MKRRILAKGFGFFFFFVRRHQRAAWQLTDNIGRSTTTCNLADLGPSAEEARSGDERGWFCKDGSASREHRHSMLACKYLCLYTMWHSWHVENATVSSRSSSQLGIPQFSFTHFLIWLRRLHVFISEMQGGYSNKMVINVGEPQRWLWWFTEGHKAISSVNAAE